MKKIFLTITFIFLSSVALAELKGEFSVAGNVTTAKEGDLIEGTLKVWPLENADTTEFAKYQNGILFNSLQLIQIQSIEPSFNNADVLELKGLFLARAAKYLTNFELNYKGELVQVPAPTLKIAPLEKKAEDYFILDQSLSLSHYQIYLIGGLVLILLLVAFIKRKKLIAWASGLKKDPKAMAIKHYREKFSLAVTRQDFEDIYARKNDWLPLLQERSLAYEEFFKVMNQHQYKPQWGSEELTEVKNRFDIIRGSFK